MRCVYPHARPLLSGGVTLPAPFDTPCSLPRFLPGLPGYPGTAPNRSPRDWRCYCQRAAAWSTLQPCSLQPARHSTPALPLPSARVGPSRPSHARRPPLARVPSALLFVGQQQQGLLNFQYVPNVIFFAKKFLFPSTSFNFWQSFCQFSFGCCFSQLFRHRDRNGGSYKTCVKTRLTFALARAAVV